MLDWNNFKNTLTYHHIAVFGLGKSGLSVVKACVQNGLNVTVWDDNEEQRQKAESLGAASEELSVSDLSKYDYLILAPGVPYTYEPNAVVVSAQKYNLKVIGDIELLSLVGIPCKTIGITGTNGKSTTTALMTHILNKNGYKSLMGGNIGVPVFDINFSEDLDFLVLELSSYQLDLCPNFRPDYSILLNITSDHLDRHGSMEAYIAAKEQILEGEGVAVVAIDDDFTQVLFDKSFLNGTRKTFPVSVHHEIPEGYFAKDNTLLLNYHDENIAIGDLEKLQTLKGVHNQQNIVCCFVVCKDIGISDSNFLKSLESFSGLPHRQYLVTQKDNISFINDSKATNAEAAAKALGAYEDIFWIIGGRSKKGGLQGLEIFKDKIAKTYVIGEAEEEFSQWLDYHGFVYERCGDLVNATRKSYKDASSFNMNATILLSPACASWDQFTSFEMRGNSFEEAVREMIA